MRFASTPVLALLLVACHGGPVSFTAPVPRSADADPYACALRQINELGYTVVDGDRDAGFIIGEKRSSGLLQTTFDRLTIAIYDDGAGGSTMRATAGRTSRDFEGTESEPSPDEAGREAARTVLLACSTGEIREQSDDGGSGATFDASI